MRTTMVDDTNYKIVTDNMFELRRKARLKQSELGEKLGVSAACICQYENARVVPKFDFMKKYCDFFGIGMDDLYNPKLIKDVLHL